MNIPLDVLVNIPGAIEVRSKDWRSFESRFEFYYLRALIRCQRMRIREGKKISQWLRGRVRLLSRLNQKIAILQKRAEKNQVKKLRHNYLNLQQEIHGKKKKNPDANIVQGNRKIWSEIKEDIISRYYTDVTEEIERLNMHLPEVLTTSEGDDETGRRLEFYFQEILREVNTMTSKTGDGEINQLGIQMKIEIEKIREQIRNIA